jgi:heptosyltransferase-2
VGVAADGRGWLLTDRGRVDTKNPERHQACSYLELLERTLGIRGEPHDLALHAADRHRVKMQSWLAERRRMPGKLIALAPVAAYGPAKEWPAEHFAALIDRLAEHGAESVMVGTAGERERCAAVAAASRSQALVAAGETNLGELVALLSLCDGFAGNDSGAMHVAAALGIPSVGIFGSTNPVRTGPLGPRTKVLYQPPACSPCLARTCRFGHYECLRNIEPAAVIDALLAIA